MDQRPGLASSQDAAAGTGANNSSQQPSVYPNPASAQPQADHASVERNEASQQPVSGSTSSSSNTPGESARKEATVTTACLACRSKHLKCDGSNPCSRCVLSGFECVYVASRRGYRGPRRTNLLNPNKRRATSPLGASEFSPHAITDSCLASPIVRGSFSSQSGLQGSPQTPHHFDQHPPSVGEGQTVARGSGTDSTRNARGSNVLRPVPLPERCIDSFYHNFFAAHPFVLPKQNLLTTPLQPSIETLLAAIRWVGSLFLPEAAAVRRELYDTVYQRIYAADTTSDGYLVQAMLLLIVALDGGCEQDKARQLLGDVETIAIQIGLHTKNFSVVNGRGIPILEESWRRTWWDLFIVDGMIAGVHRVTNFLLFDIPTDVPLPCEEHQYLSGNIPPSMTLEELETRDFSGEDREFSSFAYRILSGRTLGKFMRTPPFYGPEDENVARIEALLTNWRLHLPQNKRDALQHNGQLDEMMFQAHMMNHATSILLHQQFSQIDSSSTQSINSCAPYQMVPTGGGDLFNAHTKHTIAAASEISKLITHRVPLLSHTHFFTCVVTLSSIVHLSRWSLFWMAHDDTDLREQIRLNVGALNHLSSVWRAASTACGQVRSVAQEIYRVKKQQQSNSEYWLGFTPDAMINSIAVDDSIIGDIERISGQNNTNAPQ